jgi:hypothetical protein
LVMLPIDSGKAVRALHLFRFSVSRLFKFPMDSGSAVRSLLPVPSEPPMMIVLRLYVEMGLKTLARKQNLQR